MLFVLALCFPVELPEFSPIPTVGKSRNSSRDMPLTLCCWLNAAAQGRNLVNMPMHSVMLNRFPAERLEPIFQSLPFFAQLLTAHRADFQTLFNQSKIVVAEPGEKIISAGEFDSWFYFVLKGELAVISHEEGKAEVGHIYPGEIVGALAIMYDTERSATVLVRGQERALLLAVDYTPFGELEDFSQISLDGKILLSKLVAERTEARLRAYDKQMPNTDLAERLRALPQLSQDDADERVLHYWYERIESLSQLLKEWNLTLENLDDYHPPVTPPSAALLDDLEQLYFG